MDEDKKSTCRLYGSALLTGTIFALLITINNKNNNDHQIYTDNFSSYSRPIGLMSNTNKLEYTFLKDKSEEILVVGDENITLYQNLDDDNTIDRIRIDKITGIVFQLENILRRTEDYSTHKAEFDQADKLLLEERQRYHKQR